MIRQSSPSEQDLHDYVDGRLGADERARIAAHLSRHPEAAAIVESYRAQIAGLHALYDGALDEPIPERLRALVRRGSARTGLRRVVLAVGLPALVALSIAGGWWLSGIVHRAAAGTMALVSGAQQAHRLYGGDDRWPSDIPVARGTTMAQLLSGCIGTAVNLPEAQHAGLDLKSVQLVPTSAGCAAVLVYRDGRGRPLSFYVTPVDADDSATERAVGNGTTTLYRVSRGIGYALTLPSEAADDTIPAAFGMRP
jgi:anti-sigma factor RsiW